MKILAFDAYGTLFDVNAAIMAHVESVGPSAMAVAALWRAKQLEYTWTRTLMGRYVDFWTLTEQALDFALARHPDVPRALRPNLLDAYRTLATFTDVKPALAALKMRGCRCVVFSNGTPAMVEAAVKSAGLESSLDGIVSVDTTGRFKTAPEVYAHVCETLAQAAHEITLVSSNRWDVAGGKAFGLRTIWCNRTQSPDEYRDLPADRVIHSLAELVG